RRATRRPSCEAPRTPRRAESRCPERGLRTGRPAPRPDPPDGSRRKPRMNLDTLLPNLGEWLRGTGPESDAVLSTRIRLARNLADYPSPGGANRTQKAEIVPRVKEAITRADLPYKLEFHDVPTMPALDRQFLVERQLISRELAAVLDGPRGV